MLGIKEARDVIKQLQTQKFLCSDNTISTNNYVIVKKDSLGKITTEKIQEAIVEMIKL